MKYFKFYSDKVDNQGNHYVLDTVTNFKLFASLLCTFNDPFEGLVTASSPEYLPRVKETIDRLHTRRAVVCLSHAEKEDFVKQNIQMWAHYADNHKEFCIEYNEKILQGLTQVRDDKLGIRNENVWMDVEYVREMTNVSAIDQPDDFVAAIGRKEEKWKYENETRFIYRFILDEKLSENGNRKLGNHVSICKDAVDAIYIGLQAPNDLSERLRQFAFENHIPCYRMIFSPHSYSLEVRNVSIREDMYQLFFEELRNIYELQKH